MADVLLLIRQSLSQNKKILCHGFGHFAAYYLLTTKFDKHQQISTQKSNKNNDFDWDEQSGDLTIKGQRVCNSGVLMTQSNRPFRGKSSHALDKGVTLASKFDHVVFDSKSGSKLLKNVQTPFSFYWKSKLFCTCKAVSHIKGEILL